MLTDDGWRTTYDARRRTPTLSNRSPEWLRWPNKSLVKIQSFGDADLIEPRVIMGLKGYFVWRFSNIGTVTKHIFTFLSEGLYLTKGFYCSLILFTNLKLVFWSWLHVSRNTLISHQSVLQRSEVYQNQCTVAYFRNVSSELYYVFEGM